MGSVVIGVDIGQKRDHTAMAVVESAGHGATAAYTCRFVQRLDLGTPFPEVARRVADVAANAQTLGATVRAVRVDATGMGLPVVELIRASCRSGQSVIPVYFTHGDRLVEQEDGGLTVGKALLVSRLQVLLQDGRLQFPTDLPEGGALVDELLAYEIRVTEDANDRYGSFAVGKHDDLVTAVGLAVVLPPPIGPAAAMPGPRPPRLTPLTGRPLRDLHELVDDVRQRERERRRILRGVW